MEDYDKIKKTLAVAFMHDLDANRPEGKMCLSNGECADIEKAFNEQDWSKLARYLDKYFIEHSGCSEIPKDLEEASSKFATHTVSNGVSIEFLEEKLSFQEGAKWQMEQIMKNAKDGWIDEECVIVLNDGTCIDLQPDYDKKPAFEFEYAQNVQVIVLPKKDEK